MIITVRIKDLLNVLNEVMKEPAEAIEIEIDNNEIFIATVECGGLGGTNDFDTIKGLTEEEISELP